MTSPRADSTPQPDRRSKALTWPEILAADELPGLMCGGLLPPVGLAVAGGSPKIGKTTLGLQLALPYRSLCVIEEGGLPGLRHRLVRQAAALGLAEPDTHLLHRSGLHLDRPADVKRLRGIVAEIRPQLILADPLNLMHSGKENEAGDMRQALEPLRGIAFDFECAALLIHHVSKPSRERMGGTFDTLRGSGAIRSLTEANAILSVHSGIHKLEIEYRDYEPLTRWWRFAPDTLTFTETDAPAGAAGKVSPAALLAFMRGRDATTARDVCAEFRVTKHTALSALEASGADSFAGPRGALSYFVKEGGQP